MKKLLFAIPLLASCFSAYAGAIAGATEPTQIMNNIQLVMSYAKQIQEYNTQLQQYQAQLQDLKRNPYSALNNNIGIIIHEVGNIMSAQNSIGGTMERIDRNFAEKYGSDIAGSFADKFKIWTDASKGTLNSAMKTAGLHRDAYANDAQALQALFNRSQSSDGTVAAVQQLSALTAMQIQHSQKLGDLLATQNLAANSWMASQVSKEQSSVDNDAEIRKGFIKAAPSEIPPLDTSKKTYKKQNLYSSH
jgi:P-type conjugative transfer protein TrbJ